MDSVGRHRLFLDEAWGYAQAAPLSRRKAMLCIMLLDALVDRLLETATGDGDILVFRTELGERSSALGLVMALAGGGLAVETAAVAVPIADYGDLTVEDFMVSLYNGHSVFRLQVVLADGGRLALHDVLRDALEAVDRLPQRP